MKANHNKDYSVVKTLSASSYNTGLFYLKSTISYSSIRSHKGRGDNVGFQFENQFLFFI
ncbi:hypothetical protein AY601_1215 [Pedobacter cryoconitis]|uniref:Uncharacterized protein n=1 Tax=Pedobacter cryoconitis TaxID=188932 RepID=A0A127VA83_9SPHI|nr:hypothetical protein AY601_1215 [Pedobacter cryoconitis]